MGAIWVWHDPKSGSRSAASSLPQWTMLPGCAWKIRSLGIWNQHPMEVIDHIADYAHLGPIHGSTVEQYENEFAPHTAMQRQCGPASDPGWRGRCQPYPAYRHHYHGRVCLISYLSGCSDSIS